MTLYTTVSGRSAEAFGQPSESSIRSKSADHDPDCATGHHWEIGHEIARPHSGRRSSAARKQKLFELPVRTPIHESLCRSTPDIEPHARNLEASALAHTRDSNIRNRPERVERLLSRGKLVRREIGVEVLRDRRAIDAALLQIGEELLCRVER